MSLQAIKDIMVQLIQDTGIEMIKANTTHPPPPLPYGTYNITSPYIKGVGQEDISTFEDDTGLYQRRMEQYRMTISINLFALDNETAIDRAIKVRQWLLFLGRDFISDQNVVVADIGNIENRTTFLVNHYEYKHGFDVHFRMTDEQVRKIEWIENLS